MYINEELIRLGTARSTSAVVAECNAEGRLLFPDAWPRKYSDEKLKKRKQFSSTCTSQIISLPAIFNIFMAAFEMHERIIEYNMKI